MTENINLVIQGLPGDQVQVWYKGEDEMDEPAPVIYTGRFGSDGVIFVSVPRVHVHVGRPVRVTVLSLPLMNEVGPAKLVKLEKALTPPSQEASPPLRKSA